MASSVTTLALTLILIFNLTPETTVARPLSDQSVATTTDEANNLPFPPGLPFGGVPPLPSLFPPFVPSPFPGNIPRLPFPFPMPSSPPAPSLPGFPGFSFPPLPFPFLTPPPS
ncbi:hypothetical protein CARUB_v10025089mg [Capsella rubella]|uniref:Uncharacterized protein n=1 Tax=Capsella rubella TaxID=81985 RepID=R0HTV1_9BRAS|nr:U1 small nuclear ribonucleoprotein C [Capsella rubella]EOA28845.1 hypothetical protein CARUB_v10025089mg [Capsella rubella]